MLLHKGMNKCIFNELTIWEGDPSGAGAVGVDVSCQIFDEKPSLDADLISSVNPPRPAKSGRHRLKLRGWQDRKKGCAWNL